MPIIFSETIDEGTKIGVWKITEPEDFFSARLGDLTSVAHPRKRLQHLAGRYLLKELLPAVDLRKIIITSADKPLVSDEGPHFSISHCADMAAVMVSDDYEVGVDVELPAEKIRRISNKFLHPAELQMLAAMDHDGISLYTMAWSIKESIFKWYGLGGVDFRQHLQIHEIKPGPGWWEAVCSFNKDSYIELTAFVRKLDGFYLSRVRKV